MVNLAIWPSSTLEPLLQTLDIRVWYMKRCVMELAMISYLDARAKYMNGAIFRLTDRRSDNLLRWVCRPSSVGVRRCRRSSYVTKSISEVRGRMILKVGTDSKHGSLVRPDVFFGFLILAILAIWRPFFGRNWSIYAVFQLRTSFSQKLFSNFFSYRAWRC